MTRQQLEHARELCRAELEQANTDLSRLVAEHVAACVPLVERVDRVESELRRIDRELADYDRRREQIESVWADLAQRARDVGAV